MEHGLRVYKYKLPCQESRKSTADVMDFPKLWKWKGEIEGNNMNSNEIEPT